MRQPEGRSADRIPGERKPRDVRWAELVEAAIQVFAERGYEGASLQDIADRLGMLKGSLYYYIRTKEDLLFEVVKSAHSAGLEVAERAANTPGDPLERLERAIIAHVEYTCQTLAASVVILHVMESLPEERRSEAIGPGRVYHRVFEALVEDAKEAGLLRPEVNPSLGTLFFLGAANWVYRWFQEDGHFTATEIATQFADFSIRGIASEKAIQQRDRKISAGSASPSGH